MMNKRIAFYYMHMNKITFRILLQVTNTTDSQILQGFLHIEPSSAQVFYMKY